MGTDYYLADPDAKEVFYIDRCGGDFARAAPIEFQEVEGWPPGRARVITREVFDEVGQLEPEERHRGTFRALAWCAGRKTVLLIDDTSTLDEENTDFCFEVNNYFGPEGAPHPNGWTGSEI